MGTPARPPLEDRMAYCRHHAARLRRTLRPLEQQATVTGHSERLTRATNYLATATTQLARPDLPPAERRRFETTQLAARHTVEALQGDEADDDAVSAFETDVLSDLVEAQVPVLRAVIADVQIRHNALPA